MRTFTGIIIVIAIMLTSCGPGTIFHEYESMDNYSWNRFQVVEYDVPIEDISTGYDIILTIRHIEQIPHDKILVNFTFYTPSGEMRTMDHDIRLRSPEGKLLGDGMGDFWDLQVMMREDFRFNEEGTCKFEIHNRMPRVQTIGIVDVGLIVKKHRD